MLSEQFKREFQDQSRQCRYRLNRHLPRSMAQRLQELIPLASKFDQPDVYGKGAIINEFETQVAEIVGQPAALFLPSGTMAQPMALRIWAEHKGNPRVAFHPTSHLELHEQHAYAELHQLEAVLVGDLASVVSLADLQQITDPVAAVLLELPMREIGGQLPTWAELQAQSQWAKENDIALHMDGARVWSCPSYYQRSLAEIGNLFDSVYVSFYKDLDGISGAMLCGPEDFIQQARIWLRRCGGNLYAMYPDILAARLGLEKQLPRMPEYVAKTEKLARCFAAHPVFQIIPEQPPCNLFHLVVNLSAELLMPQVIACMQASSVAILPLPRSGESHSCFEITIGDAALAKSDEQWQVAISYLADRIAAIQSDEPGNYSEAPINS
ncbi:threonine aldolase family protein [Teredinibacter turnerae]|uniref:threonine aldolase family protein n=1 Tax=Teredinibacter turnerae TaxID=2426 RepID=UPI0030D47366